jgi:hypothetical protein
MSVRTDEQLSHIRLRLKDTPSQVWQTALGEVGDAYKLVWSIIEGEE